MSEDILTWTQIKERYPDEWVIVVDHEQDPMTVVASGRVLYHGKDRDEVHGLLSKVTQDSAAIVFTGEPRASMVAGLTRVVIPK